MGAGGKEEEKGGSWKNVGWVGFFCGKSIIEE